MSDNRKTVSMQLRTEAADLVAAAIDRYGFSDVTVDPANPTILHATLRGLNTSRVFTARIQIMEATEV